MIEAARIQPGMRVLEVGGGSGQIATTLAKHWDVTVFTLEPWFGGAHIQTRAADEGVWERVVGLKLKAQELPFADETFDAIISVGSFEMIGGDRPSALGEMVRVAKVGARIGIAEPMCMPMPIPPDVAEIDRAGNLTFEHHFRSAEWNAELFRGTGLKVVEQSYFPDAFRLVAEIFGRRSGFSQSSKAYAFEPASLSPEESRTRTHSTRRRALDLAWNGGGRKAPASCGSLVGDAFLRG